VTGGKPRSSTLRGKQNNVGEIPYRYRTAETLDPVVDRNEIKLKTESCKAIF
jgi:hypothetical protein